MRRFALVALVACGCHSSKTSPGKADAATSSANTMPLTHATAPARFSRPLAALRVAAPAPITIVAGLVVPTGTVAVSAIDAGGSTLWTHDVIRGVAWSANATLTVLRSRPGAVIVWRGLRGKDEVTLAADIAFDGTALGDAYPVGAAACTTDEGLAWIDRGPKATWLVKTRAFGSASSLSALTLAEDRDPALLCGAHRVFALADGDDDVTLSSPGDDAHAPPIRIIQDATFRGDDERSHETFAVNDDLGVVRIGLSGSLAVREANAGHLTPWRRFGNKLLDGDDVTLVDANANEAVIAFTREAAGDAGAGGTVEAFAWERKGTREARYTLAPADGSHVRGPFWSGSVTGGVVIGWAERGARADSGEAPITGLAFRTVSLDGLGEPRRIDRPADELVDAGCDDSRCYAVALARADGEDGGQPEVAAVLAYP